jgi:hypothetical protein
LKNITLIETTKVCGITIFHFQKFVSGVFFVFAL